MKGKKLIRGWAVPFVLVGLFTLILTIRIRLVQPSVADNSTCLVFREERAGYPVIWDIDSGGWTRFKPQIRQRYKAAASPDSKYMVYIKRGKQPETFIIQVETTNMGVIAEVGNVDRPYQVSWSPDGKYLAMGARSIDRFGQTVIVLVKLDGTASRVIPLTLSALTSLEWSPDNTYIVGVYISEAVLVRMSDFSTHPIPIHHDIEFNRFLNWSPGGHQIAYLWGKSTKTLGIFDPDTDTERSVELSPKFSARGVSWSPDARFIATAIETVYSPRRYRLKVFDLHNTASLVAIEVGESSNDFGEGWWSPDSHAYIFIKAGQNALVAYYPDSHRYETLIPDNVLRLTAVQHPSPDVPNAVFVRQQGDKVSVGVFDSSSLHITEVLDDVNEVTWTYWWPNRKTLLIASRRDKTYRIDMVNIATRETTRLLDGLSDAPVINRQPNDRSRISFWWQTASTGGLSVYTIPERKVTTFNLESSQRSTPYWSIGGSREYLSPNKDHAAFIVPERSQQRSIQIASRESLAPKVLYRGTQFDEGILTWSPDSSKFVYSTFSIAGVSIEVVRPDGTNIRSWNRRLRLEYPVWSSCNPNLPIE